VLLLIRDPERITTHGPRGLLSGIGDILKIRALWPLLPITAVSYAVVLSERGFGPDPTSPPCMGWNPWRAAMRCW
jgi:hypothetical protein